MPDDAQRRTDERAPLLGPGGAGRNDGAAAGGEDVDFVLLNRQIQSRKRRRWISLVAVLLLLAGVVVIMVLSGSEFFF